MPEKIDDHAARHRPPDAARGLPAPARRRHGAAFLLESVDQGRLGRYSLVGCGSRLVSLAEAERCGEPVVGYLGYDCDRRARADRAAAARGLRPAGEPLRRRRDAAALRPRPRRLGGARGRPDAIAALLARPLRPPQAASGHRSGPLERFPDRATYTSAGRPLQGAHPRAATPSRSCSPSGPSGRRRPRRSRSTARCAASTPPPTCSCSSSATSRSSAPRPRRS